MRPLLLPLLLLVLAGVPACAVPKKPTPKKPPSAPAPKKGPQKPAPAVARPKPSPAATQVTILSFPKDAKVLRAKKPLKGVKRGTVIKVGDVLVTGKGGGVNFRHGDLGIGRLRPESRCVFQELFRLVSKEIGVRRSRLKLEKGAFGARLWRLLGQTRYEVGSPSMVMAAKGTVFVVEVSPNASRVIVTEGEVEISLPKEPRKILTVSEGQRAVVAKALPLAPQPLDDADLRKAREFEELKARVIRETDPMIARIDELIEKRRYKDAMLLSWAVFEQAWGTRNAVRAQARAARVVTLDPGPPNDNTFLLGGTPRYAWNRPFPNGATMMLISNGWKLPQGRGVRAATADPTGWEAPYFWSIEREELKAEIEKFLADVPSDSLTVAMLQGQYLVHAFFGVPDETSRMTSADIASRLNAVTLPAPPSPMAQRQLLYFRAHYASDTNDPAFPELCEQVANDPEQPKVWRLFALYRRCAFSAPSERASMAKYARQMLPIAAGNRNLDVFTAYAHAFLGEFSAAAPPARRVLNGGWSISEVAVSTANLIGASHFNRGDRKRADEWKALGDAYRNRVQEIIRRESGAAR